MSGSEAKASSRWPSEIHVNLRPTKESLSKTGPLQGSPMAVLGRNQPVAASTFATFKFPAKAKSRGQTELSVSESGRVPRLRLKFKPKKTYPTQPFWGHPSATKAIRLGATDRSPPPFS